MKKAVILLSGGLDSATTLYAAKKKGYKPYCLIFDYGQRHSKELVSAKKIAEKAGALYKVVKISLPWKGSSLLDKNKPLPCRKGCDITEDKIPSTYVPARNTIFLSFALSYAESIRACDIFIGANALDYSGYPDCRPEYFKVFNRLSLFATKTGIDKKPIVIRTPLINLKKSEIIGLGIKLGVPYELTWSCYKGSKRPCGKCDSCKIRSSGFAQAGLKDPLLK